jgi:hypothetical protein
MNVVINTLCIKYIAAVDLNAATGLLHEQLYKESSHKCRENTAIPAT